MKTKSALSLSIFLPARHLMFVLLAAGGAAGSLFAQTFGGPDTYGYTWKNQADPNGPTYSWKDIKGIGTQITGLGDDNSVGTFNLNWDFHYYWNDYNKALVGSNGWLSFQPLGNIASPFPTIPSATTPNNFIAAFLSDLTFTDVNLSQVPGTTAWYWTNNLDSFIVQYDSVPFWVNSGQKFTGRNTFQIILSGVDSSITFQYRYQSGFTNGTDIKSGIENLTGQIGLQVLNNTYPTANTAVKFYYPNPVTYQIFDATPAWNQNAENGGFFVSANGIPQNLKTDIENAGNQPVNNIAITGEILDAAFTQVWDTTASVFSLLAGADSLLTYPKTYSANTPGTFTYRSTITLAGDMNPGNDASEVEMVVVDTTQPIIGLSYSEATNAGAGLSWSSGGINDGGGVYIVPPFYPASVVSLDYFIDNGTTGGFTAEIRDDNGVNNTPGTVLSSDTNQSAILGSYNNVPMTAPVVISSGGIYVSWHMYPDTTVVLGVDISTPFSLRNYEIIGGSWASYRDNSAGDLMIRANISKYNFGAITSTSTADACPTNGSGSATVTVISGASPPYTYLWNTGGQTTATATGLAAGNHTVTITDSLGIANTTVVQVYSNIAVTAVSTTSVTCFGENTGASTATIGGTAPYTYLWSNGQTSQTATGLTVGIYTVTASNTDGCSNFAIDTIDGPTVVANTFSVTPATCVGGDGTATSTVTGGIAPYTYLWNNLQTTATATGLAAASYTLAITDANGCTSSAITTITSIPFLISASSVPTSCSGGNGSATATANSGGTAPYTYSWTTTPVQSTQTATGLSAGQYTATITDANGCTSSAMTTVTTTPFLTSASSSPETCVGGDGTATANATSGGTAPYTYSWATTPVQNTQTATGLSAGPYTANVTDATGCTSSTIVTIGNVPFISSATSTPTFCLGSSDGVVTSVVFSGGTPPYTYAWSPVGQITQVVTGLPAGTYTIVTSDAVGCSTTKTTTVGSPLGISPNVSSQPASCLTCTNGSATASPSGGGTAPYTYLWNTGAITQTITGLGPGNYTVCVTDLFGCSSCDTVNVVINGVNEIYNGASVVISPNPFNSSALVTIDLVKPTHDNLLFTLFDIYGREIQSIDLREYGGSTINFILNRGYNIPNGMYFYRLEDAKGILYAGKLLVQ